MEIKRFQIFDRQEVLRLHRDVYGAMRLASFEWQPCQQVESLERDGEKYVCRDDRLTGYAAAYRLDEAHFRLNLLVDPQQTGLGIGTRLLGRVEAELRELGGRYLQARLLEGMTASLPFAQTRGFEVVHRMRGMSLRARDFSGQAQWGRLGERLAARGFVAVSLQEELVAGGDPLAKLAALNTHAQAGWPSPDPTQEHEPSIERAKSLFEGVTEPARFSIMKLGAEYVAYTSARNAMIPTAVHPAYRNLGIATWLKAYDISHCIADGQAYFESATANPAMQRVNEKLGYQFNGLAEVRLVKKL